MERSTRVRCSSGSGYASSCSTWSRTAAPGRRDPLRTHPLRRTGRLPPDPARGRRRTRRHRAYWSANTAAACSSRPRRSPRNSSPTTAAFAVAARRGRLVEPRAGAAPPPGGRPRSAASCASHPAAETGLHRPAAPGRRRPDGHRASAHPGRAGPHPAPPRSWRPATSTTICASTTASTSTRPSSRSSRPSSTRRRPTVLDVPVLSPALLVERLTTGHPGQPRRVRPLDLPRRPLPHRLPARPRHLRRRAAPGRATIPASRRATSRTATSSSPRPRATPTERGWCRPGGPPHRTPAAPQVCRPGGPPRARLPTGTPTDPAVSAARGCP